MGLYSSLAKSSIHLHLFLVISRVRQTVLLVCHSSLCYLQIIRYKSRVRSTTRPLRQYRGGFSVSRRFHQRIYISLIEDVQLCVATTQLEKSGKSRGVQTYAFESVFDWLKAGVTFLEVSLRVGDECFGGLDGEVVFSVRFVFPQTLHHF